MSENGREVKNSIGYALRLAYHIRFKKVPSYGSVRGWGGGSTPFLRFHNYGFCEGTSFYKVFSASRFRQNDIIVIPSP